MKSSNFVQERVAKTHALIELVESCGPALDAQASEGVWATLMPQVDNPISSILNAQLGRLKQANTLLDTVTTQTAQEKEDDLDLRGEIGEAIIILRETIDRTRNRIIEIDSLDTLQIYNMASPPPRAKQALIDYTRTAIDLMRAHPYTFQDVLGESIDTKRVAKFLAETLAPLETLVHQMDDEMEELQHAIKQRNDALEEWSCCYHGTSHLLEGFLRLAGMDEAVEQLRHLS